MSLARYCSSQIHVNLSNTGVSWQAMCATYYLLAVQLQISSSCDTVSCMLPAWYDLISSPCSHLSTLVVHGPMCSAVVVAQQGVGMHGAAQLDMHKEE